MRTLIAMALIGFIALITGIAYGASNDEILSQHIKEADGTSGQDTNTGSGIKTRHIQNGAVTAIKIKEGSVTSGKIANGAVTNTKIATGAITPDKIGFYGNVAVVAASGGDYTNPVTAMNNVSSWCGTPSATNPCLLKIMPDVYNIGSGSIQMRRYVDIDGSGENTTKIIGNIQGYSTGVVRGASNAEIRYLTIENHGTSGFIRGIYNSGASPTISNITINVSGATINPQGYAENRGIANENNSMPLIKNVTINASGIHACGIINSDSTPTIENTTISVSQNPSMGYYISGIESLGNCSLTIRDTTVDVSGGTDAIGIHLRYGSASISNISVTVKGGTVANKGFLNVSTDSPYTVTIDNSRIHGDTYSIENGNNYTTKVGASKLEGPIHNVGGTVICAGVYNGNYQFFTNTCP